MKIFLLFLTFCLLWLGALFYAGHYTASMPLPLEHTLIVDIPQGNGVRALSQALVKQNPMIKPVIVRFLARLTGYDRRLKAGEYQIEPSMSLNDVFELIASGKVLMHKLTLPEGLTTAQFMVLIKDNPYLSGELTAKVSEGELLPETYTFPKGLARNRLVTDAKEAMQRQVEKIWATRDQNLPLKNADELRILASIVEKETGIADERGKVASVFINRLKQGMLLQTDPTVIYALTNGQKDLGRSLTHQDLQIDSPYNTYKYIGLPPTPIATPGKASLQAVAHPEETPYFYFVASGTGGHNFAKSLAEHNRNVKAWKNKNH